MRINASIRPWKSPVCWILLAHSALLAWGAWVHSPTIDEIAHLPSGLSHLKWGRFECYRVNPPLVRMLAAVPIALMNPHVDESLLHNIPGDRPEGRLGERFLEDNGPRVFWLFIIGRWTCISFSILGGYLCFRWARELYGYAAGLLALLLWCFCPNIIAHGQLLTPDLGAAALGLAAIYAFWHWLRLPDWLHAVVAGSVLGLAELTKMTWLVLYGVFPLLWLICRWQPRRLFAPGWRGGELVQLMFIDLLSLVILNLGYGFSHSFQRLGEFSFISTMLTGEKEQIWAPGNRFRGTCLEALPVPIPADYLLGLDTQKADFEKGALSYLRGEWKKGGWWYYYLYALLVKVPLGTWALSGLALLCFVLGCGYAASWRDQLTLILPALTVFGLVSSQTGFNHHLRYVLPIFPLAFIWLSQVGRSFSMRHKATAMIVSLCISASVLSSLAVYPHSLSYFHELAGGPLHGHEHLLNSNCEWGQDLFFLKHWLDEHPEAKMLKMIVFADCRPHLLGIETAGRPPLGPPHSNHFPEEPEGEGPQPGWYAVGVTFLHCDGWEMAGVPKGKGKCYYGYFQHFRPLARAGYSIYIYHITPNEAEYIRQQFGFSKLPEGSTDEIRNRR